MTLKIEACLFDADGVLYRGNKPVINGPETIKILRERGIKIGVITNNSTRSKEELLQKLHSYGYDFSEEEIMSSAIAISNYVAEEKPNAKVFVIGEDGLKTEMKRKGIIIIENKDSPVDYVVVGLDRQFTYEKIETGMQHILKGAKFYVTNTDKTLPVEGGKIPGAGVMVNSLITCTDKNPEVIIGKPSDYMYKKFLEKIKVKPENALFVGDRVETDILGAFNAGLIPILILTGVTSNNNYTQELRKNKLPVEKIKVIHEFPELLKLI